LAQTILAQQRCQAQIKDFDDQIEKIVQQRNVAEAEMQRISGGLAALAQLLPEGRSIADAYAANLNGLKQAVDGMIAAANQAATTEAA